MGDPKLKNDGSIERVDLDGQNRKTIIPEGGTFTPKQLHLDKKNGKLYWCDREGMRVMRSNLDGSKIETLVDTSQGDARPGRDANEMVRRDHRRSRARANLLDAKRPGQCGTGPHFSRKHRNPERRERGQSHGHRIAFRRSARADRSGARSEEPRSCTGPIAEIRHAGTRSIAPRWMRISSKRPAPKILVTHLMEGIGIALDLTGDRMFLTDLAGSVYSAKLDGSEKSRCSRSREISPESPTLKYRG